MTTTYYVIKVYDCPECGGTGMMVHPMWELFWADWTCDHDDIQPTMDNIERWFRDAGFSDPPNEEIGCAACDAVGTIREEVDITEIIAPLNQRITALERGLEW